MKKQALPFRIYLTNGDDSAKVFGDPDEITWSADKISDSDVAYIREDGKGRKRRGPIVPTP